MPLSMRSARAVASTRLYFIVNARASYIEMNSISEIHLGSISLRVYGKNENGYKWTPILHAICTHNAFTRSQS